MLNDVNKHFLFAASLHVSELTARSLSHVPIRAPTTSAATECGRVNVFESSEEALTFWRKLTFVFQRNGRESSAMTQRVAEIDHLLKVFSIDCERRWSCCSSHDAQLQFVCLLLEQTDVSIVSFSGFIVCSAMIVTSTKEVLSLRGSICLFVCLSVSNISQKDSERIVMECQ